MSKTIDPDTVFDIGAKTKTKPEKLKVTPIDQINDLELLNRMVKQTISRGKRQRIKKRIALLNGTSQADEKAPSGTDQAKKEQPSVSIRPKKVEKVVPKLAP